MLKKAKYRMSRETSDCGGVLVTNIWESKNNLFSLSLILRWSILFLAMGFGIWTIVESG